VRGVCAAGTAARLESTLCSSTVAHSCAHCLRVCAAVKYLLCLDFKL
jgi:hypothetical protein